MSARTTSSTQVQATTSAWASTPTSDPPHMASAACRRTRHAHLRHGRPARHASAMPAPGHHSAVAQPMAAGPGCRRVTPAEHRRATELRGMATAARRCRRTPLSPLRLGCAAGRVIQRPASGRCIRPRRLGRQARSPAFAHQLLDSKVHIGSWRSAPQLKQGDSAGNEAAVHDSTLSHPILQGKPTATRKPLPPA